MTKKITVIGGGTGTSVVLSGLKSISNDLDLSAVVVVSDSGGSTGRLRDEFGFLPVGDLRQCLAALAQDKNQQEIRQLLLYRFSKGHGLKGHNLGNLILTALEDLSLSPALAIETASRIFNIQGNVYPITEKIVDLEIEYVDGTKKVGEHILDDLDNGGVKIKQVRLKPEATIYNKAAKTIRQSDMIVLGPGDLYASLLPNACVRGFKQALEENNGLFVYILNLMTHFSQTHQMTAKDHLDEVVKYTGRYPDVIVINCGEIESEVIKMYEKKLEFPVIDDLEIKSNVIREDLVNSVIVKRNKADSVFRSLLRHDSKKLAQLLIKLI